MILDARDPAFFGKPELWDEDEIPTDPDFDVEDNELLDDFEADQGIGPRKGHIRHAFINSAIDRVLVESIFRLIDGAKPKDRSLPLEEAYFTTAPGGFVGNGVTLSSIMDLCRIIGQNWIVRRSPRDDSRDVPDAVLWPGDVDRLRHSQGSIDEEEIVQEWATIRAPFRKAWPLLSDEDDCPEEWQKHWHSYPLEV